VRRAALVDSEGRSVAEDADASEPPVSETPPKDLGVVVTPSEGRVRATAGFLLPNHRALWVDVVLSTEREDAAVAASRTAILVGAGLAALVSVAAAILLSLVDRRHQRTREALEARREEDRRLAEAGALASLFTHEMSNPLNSVRLGLRLLDGEGTPEERRRVAATVRQEADRMAATLESFLALAKARRPGLERTDPEVLEAVRRRVAALAADRGVRLDVGVGTAGPPASANPAVVEQALSSVVRNAVQASPAGETVSVRWEGDAGRVRVVVTDRGPGFPPDRDRLLRVGDTTKSDGHGLGLALARRFLEAEGGAIALLDADGGGARVEVTLPSADREGPS
jgi:signal transduction histidine kinase